MLKRELQRLSGIPHFRQLRLQLTPLGFTGLIGFVGSIGFFGVYRVYRFFWGLIGFIGFSLVAE